MHNLHLIIKKGDEKFIALSLIFLIFLNQNIKKNNIPITELINIPATTSLI